MHLYSEDSDEKIQVYLSFSDIYDQFKSIKQIKYNEVRLLCLEFCDHAQRRRSFLPFIQNERKFDLLNIYFYFSHYFKNLGASFLTLVKM